MEAVSALSNGSDHNEIQARVAAKMDKAQPNLITEFQKQQFLESLSYDEIFARLDQVSAPQEATFERIFDECLGQAWPSFPEWLMTGKETYWIKGKAGSGKSSLMKFILDHQQTLEYLRRWCRLKQPLVVSFFLWRAGSTMQKSLQGLALSLVYQILKEDQEAMDNILRDMPKLCRKHKACDWETSEALGLFYMMIQQRSNERPLCFFIDGLDEFDHDDDFEQLSDMVRTLALNPSIKLCISARPETHIISLLSESPSLRLQDLTSDGNALFVSEQFKDSEHRIGRTFHITEHDREKLIRTLVERAGGSFIWIRLAVKVVLRGLVNQESARELQLRVENLPTETENLYEDILRRIGPDLDLYKREASLYLKVTCMLLSVKSPADDFNLSNILLYYVVAASKYLPPLQNINKDTEISDVLQACEATIVRINACCDGMLEVLTRDRGGRHDLIDSTVVVAHRTVENFLLEQPVGRQLLDKAPADEHELLCTFVESRLLHNRLVNAKNFLSTARDVIHEMLSKCLATTIPAIDRRLFCAFVRDQLRTYFSGVVGYQTTDTCEWELQLSRRLHWLEIDFLSFAVCHLDLEVFLELAGAEERILSPYYRDYLLFCIASSWSLHRPGPDSHSVDTFRHLIAAGANPNTAFYLPLSFPVKSSTWSWATNQLRQSLGGPEYQVEFVKALIEQINRNGAASTQCDLYVISFSAGGTSLVSFNDPGFWDYGYRMNSRYCMLCEVNAKYMLEWHNESRLIAEMGFSDMVSVARPLLMWRLSQPESLEDDEESQPEVPSRYESGICFAGIDVVEVPPKDADFFLLAAEKLWRSGLDENLYDDWVVDEEWQDPSRLELQEIFATAKKIFDDSERADLKDVLRKHGYYKDPDDPAVFQRPITQFEDG